MSPGSGSNDDKPTLVGPIAGVVVGVVVFVGANFTAGRAIIPTAESVVDPTHGLSAPQRPVPEQQVAGSGAGGAYQTTCQACHQAQGEGVAGAFPPLAGSEWVTGDPETPIRIALLGLKGEIEVKGVTYNSLMPKPPGLTDEQLVEAVNHARTNFGNSATEIDLALVQKVKASIGDRTEPWTAAELTALRTASDGEGEGEGEGGGGDEEAVEAAGDPAADPEQAAADTGEAPATGEAPEKGAADEPPPAAAAPN